MDDVKYSSLMYPDIEVAGKHGETVLKIKKVYEGGNVHYFFENNYELMSDEEKTEFNEFWNNYKKMAGEGGISLFDYSEYLEAVKPYLNDLMTSKEADRVQTEADYRGRSVNVQNVNILLLDHATEKITSLNIEINVKGKPSEDDKRIFNI